MEGDVAVAMFQEEKASKNLKMLVSVISGVKPQTLDLARPCKRS